MPNDNRLVIDDELFDTLLEALINYFANPEPEQNDRDKVLRALIELRDAVEGGGQ